VATGGCREDSRGEVIPRAVMLIVAEAGRVSAETVIESEPVVEVEIEAEVGIDSGAKGAVTVGEA